MSYLFQRAANRGVLPLCAAEIEELLAEILVGISRQVIVDAGQFLTEEALLAAMPSKCASSGLVFGGICLGVAQGREDERCGPEQRSGSMAHPHLREGRASGEGQATLSREQEDPGTVAIRASCEVGRNDDVVGGNEEDVSADVLGS